MLKDGCGMEVKRMHGTSMPSEMFARLQHQLAWVKQYKEGAAPCQTSQPRSPPQAAVSTAGPATSPVPPPNLSASRPSLTSILKNKRAANLLSGHPTPQPQLESHPTNPTEPLALICIEYRKLKQQLLQR